MENTKESLKCPICQNDYDSSIRVPKILVSCGHTACSVCLTTEALENGKIVCPEDLIVYDKVDSIENLPTNKTLLALLEGNSHLPSTPQRDAGNYIRKSSTLRTSLKKSPSFQVCLLHSLPLDVICIDDKMKLCSQCTLQPEHAKHTIVTDEEFMNQIDNLIDLFQEVDCNLQKYVDKENISAKNILDTIDFNCEEMKVTVKTKTEELIKNVQEQSKAIIEFINERNKEIHLKYENTSFDIKDLNKATNNWMETVRNKLDLLNEINEPTIECVKLIDDDPNKNQQALINSGHQLNDRYGFISKTEEIIDKLNDYCDNGLKIFPIKEVFDIIASENKTNPCCVSSKLFNVVENESLIEKLRLKKFTFENYLHSSNNINSINYISNNAIMSGNSKIFEDFKEQPTLKEEDIQNEMPNYQRKSGKHFSSQENLTEDRITTISSQPEERYTISPFGSNSKEKKDSKKNSLSGSGQSSKRPKTPSKDKSSMIKSQLKNESVNFGRIELGEEGIECINQFFKSKQVTKYKELKFVKCSLGDEGAIALLKSIVSNNIIVSNLNISNNSLTDKSGEMIIQLLSNSNSHKLKTLYVSGNSFTFQMKEKIKSYSNTPKGFIKIFI